MRKEENNHIHVTNLSISMECVCVDKGGSSPTVIRVHKILNRYGWQANSFLSIDLM
jgi:hypothetical protein